LKPLSPDPSFPFRHFPVFRGDDNLKLSSLA